MKKIVKFLINHFFLKKIYFGIRRFIRRTIELNDTIHILVSIFAFNLKNVLGWNIEHVPFFLAKKIDSNSIIIDCGANVGVIVKPLLVYGPRLYCFEPNPLAFEQLSINMNYADNVQLINKAVGTESKMAKLFKHVSSKDSIDNEKLNSVSSSLLAYKANVDTDNYYEVEIINFIEFLKDLNERIYIIKIDIEGAEVELVNAILDNNLHNQIDYMFVETHENTIPELKESTREMILRAKDLGLNNIYFNWV